MNKEQSVIQVVAKRFQAGASDDICVLHPSDPYFFHIPGDPFHILTAAVQVDANGDALFKRPAYLFQISISGNSFHESRNCALDSIVHQEGCEQTFRHMGYKLQGLTDYLLSDRSANQHRAVLRGHRDRGV